MKIKIKKGMVLVIVFLLIAGLIFYIFVAKAADGIENPWHPEEPDGGLIANANGPYTDEAKQIMTFYGSATGGTSPYVGWEWDFSDGIVIDKKTATRTFQQAGNYTVTFTVTDSEGQTGIDTTTITIIPEGQIPEDPPEKPDDFQAWWKQQIRIEYVDGTTEIVGASSDTALTVSRFGKEIANFVYLLHAKVNPAGDMQRVLLVLSGMTVVIDDGYENVRQIADPNQMIFDDFPVPADGQWHTIVEIPLSLTFAAGGTVQVYCQEGDLGTDGRTPRYYIDAIFSSSTVYYPDLPMGFTFEIDAVAPNQDIVYEYNDEWDGNTQITSGFQTFKIGAVGNPESIKLTRIRVRGYNYETDPCNTLTLSLFGYYSGRSDGLPWPVPPLPVPLSTKTVTDIPSKGSTEGNWVEFDFSDENILIPPNTSYSFYIKTDTGVYIGNTFASHSVYPGGKHATYSPSGDTPTGVYYDWAGNRDLVFQVFGIKQ